MSEIKIIDPADGSTIRIISDPLRTMLTLKVITYMVSRTMFCPFTGKILDRKTCVAVIDPQDDVKTVMSPEGWREVRGNWSAVVERFPGCGITSQRASSLKVD